MAENQKTKSLGTISVTKLSKLPEWQKYADAAKAFSHAKDAAQKAKTAMKEALKKGSADLRDIEGLDFTYVDGQKEIAVFQQLQQSTRRASKQIAFG